MRLTHLHTAIAREAVNAIAQKLLSSRTQVSGRTGKSASSIQNFSQGTKAIAVQHAATADKLTDKNAPAPNQVLPISILARESAIK